MEISQSRKLQLAQEAFQHLVAGLDSSMFGRRCHQVYAARVLREAERTGHYLRRGCRTIGEYGRRIGYSEEEAEMLVAVGRALELRPEFREEIVTRKVLLEDAAAWGRAADGARVDDRTGREEEEPPTGGR